MINHFCKTPLWKAAPTLAAVAGGKKPAEIVIRGAKLVNVCTAEIIPDTDVAIAEGRIALIGDASHCIGEGTTVIDAQGQYIAPGFLDGHIHVESSMLTMREYAKAVVSHGSVGIFMDPHEICNVLGADGVKLMVDESKCTPLKAMVTYPSCVPAVPGFEDTGSFVGPKDIAEQMKSDSVVGLGEMMNFPGVLNATDHASGIVGETLKAGKIATGHYSIPENGAGLNAYIASGIRCCHESTRAEDALAKMRLGMYALLREGSAWQDLKEVSRSIIENKIDSRYACLISDDTHPNTLIAHGHLDHIMRKAISYGIDPVKAIQMVTINTAQCFQLDHELGSIAPGKCADIVFIKDLEGFEITRVLIDGAVVAENGDLCVEIKPFNYPHEAKHSMHISQKITPETFAISSDGKDQATVRVIEVIPARVGTYERHITLKATDGNLNADTEQDVLKAFVFERHHATGTYGAGFVKGFKIGCGAMASTVAHDAHNLLVLGTNDEDMALAANTLIECGGGMVTVQNGKVLGLVELPVAGLMNDQKTAAQMSETVEGLEHAWASIGCDLPSPFMTMALVPLACLPELRLTNRGLVDCTTFSFVPLMVGETE